MKKLWPIIALGVGAYLLFALFTLPAGVLLSQLSSLGVNAAGVTGTAWRGRAQVLQVGGQLIGTVEWNLHILPLFAGRANADIKVTRSDGFAQGEITLYPSGRTSFEQFTAALPLSALPPDAAPGGWTGTLNVKLDRLTLEHGWPTSAEGTIEAMGVTGPARKPANLGNYRVVFPAPDAPQSPDALVGALSDAGGPLQITGTLKIKDDRSYLIEGLIATRPDAPREVANALQYLGAPDADGRRHFSLEGTM